MRAHKDLLFYIVRLIESLLFKSKRADYYAYLAYLLQGSDGKITLKGIFAQDAERYSSKTLRGRMSKQWLRLYQSSGGDLYSTWIWHLPHNELVLIRLAQSMGNLAIINTLSSMSSVVKLIRQSGHLLLDAIWPALVAIMVVISSVVAVPYFTLPRLMSTFNQVEPQYYGPHVTNLLSMGLLVDKYLIYVVIFAILLCIFIWWSIPNLVGKLRSALDKFLWWEVYRHVSALRFLLFLSISLDNTSITTTKLRTALVLQRQCANPWLGLHIDQMITSIDKGKAGSSCFNTGLLSAEMFWFFSDVEEAQDLGRALTLTSIRLKDHILQVIRRKATVTRWLLLLGCVFWLLTLVLWHYAAIDELRRALTYAFS